MASEKSTLSKSRKIEKSFEDLLTGLSDESDDDIDDLVNFDHLPEMCSDSTLIAIEKTNRAFTSSSMKDSLKMADFEQPKPTETKEKKNDIFDNDDFFTEQSSNSNEKKDDENLLDFDDVPQTTGSSNVLNNDLLNFGDSPNENVIDSAKLIEDFDESEEEEKEEEVSAASNEVEESEDKYEPNFEMRNDDRGQDNLFDIDGDDENVEVMVTDESGNAIDMEQEPEVNGLQRDDSIDLDAIVQDNTHLDVEIGKQKTALRKKGSLAKRRKPSRTSVHSMGAADESSKYTDSTDPKPSVQNGHVDAEEVFSRDSDSSPPAKKPLPGMVALPGMGLPIQKRSSRGSTPSDSDITPDESRKDFRNIGVKLPVPTSCGNSESENQSEISSTRLRKTSEKEAKRPAEEPTHQFEKPKLKTVSRPGAEKKETDNSTFEKPPLKQVERTPSKSKSFPDESESRHEFQSQRLRRVEDPPTESLQFVQGKTREDDDDDSRHVFATPKLKKVDSFQSKSLQSNRSDEAHDSEMTLNLGDHGGESCTDDLNTGIYFEKPPLRNVPKPRENKGNVDRVKLDIPELKNVPKTELDIKSPTESDKKFNVPQLKSVQKEKVKEVDNQNQESDSGTFQIPSLRRTPMVKRKETPKSPEIKRFDVPALRRTPRDRADSSKQETDTQPLGVFERPKLKSARSLQQDMEEPSSKDSHSKHKFDKPTLRNTPTKADHSVQRAESNSTDKPAWLQETRLKPTREPSLDSAGDQEKDKPSWLQDAKENSYRNTDTLESVPRKSSIPLQENRHENINGHATPSRTRLTSSGSNDGEDLKTKKSTGRDQYTPSWLKTTDTRGKSPSTPNLAFVTPSKDTDEVPLWKRELAEKRRGRKDSDVGQTPKKTDGSKDKELPPWKVELGQMKMRQTPAKGQESKAKSTEPEWKKAAEEKRNRLRSLGDSNYDDDNDDPEAVDLPSEVE